MPSLLLSRQGSLFFSGAEVLSPETGALEGREGEGAVAAECFKMRTLRRHPDNRLRDVLGSLELAAGVEGQFRINDAHIPQVELIFLL